MSLVREIISLPLEDSVVDLLYKKGFRYVSEIISMKPLELSKELDISGQLHIIYTIYQIHDINHMTFVSSLFLILPGQMAMHILKSINSATEDNVGGIESTNKRSIENKIDSITQLFQESYIITLCKLFDQMMGGGVPTGQITEFVGLPGIGKTQVNAVL